MKTTNWHLTILKNTSEQLLLTLIKFIKFINKLWTIKLLSIQCYIIHSIKTYELVFCKEKIDIINIILKLKKQVHSKTTYEWHTDDIRVDMSDIRMTYDYIQVTHGWHTSTYEWHTKTYERHTNDIRLYTNDIWMT